MPRTNLSAVFTPAERAAWKPKIVARNTFRYERDGVTILRLHRTDIARKYQDGTVKLDSGGWKTVTTRDRMNSMIPAGYSLYQKSGIWYVREHGKDGAVPYFDGIEVPRCFKDKTAQSRGTLAKDTEEAQRKAVLKFAALITAENIPMPSAGDCFLCSLHSADGKSMGDHGGADSEKEHVWEHIKEGYLHGSLIVNALRFKGYPHPTLLMHPHSVALMRRAVRSYLHHKLGLGAS